MRGQSVVKEYIDCFVSTWIYYTEISVFKEIRKISREKY